jgi:hypothetical protein
LFTVVVMSAALVVGCSAHEPEATGIRSPAEFHAAVARKEQQREQRVEQAISGCMHDQGFDYVERQVELPTILYPEQYGFTDSLIESATSPPNPSSSAATEAGSSDPAYQSALNGADGGGGCRASAEASVAPTIDASTAQALDEAAKRLYDTDEYRRMVTDWSSCVAERVDGAVIELPDQAENYLGQRWSEILVTHGHAGDQGLLPPSVLALSESARRELFDEIGAIEAQLHDADMSCRSSSGLEQIERDATALVMAALPDDFFDVD